MGSVWGSHIKVSIFGESHGNGIGVMLDGFPSGIIFDEDFVKSEMLRRAPGRNKQSTKRKESDIPKILSGIYQGYTTGTPICAIIENNDQKSNDYKDFSSIPRPSHADYTGLVRYGGYNDPRGGGHFSGRLTAPLVFAGALCKLFLKNKSIYIGSHIQSIAQIQDTPFDDVNINISQLDELRKKEYPIINDLAKKSMLASIEDARINGDSVGGVIECCVVGIPAGLGNPIFDTVESKLSSILFSVPAVKGVEFGAGFGFANLKGSHANDVFILTDDEKVLTETNNNGGILGGITSGMPIVFKTVIKPTPSISKRQNTLNLSSGEIEELTIHGRHDPCIVIRATPVIEAATAIAIADIYLEGYGYAQSK